MAFIARKRGEQTYIRLAGFVKAILEAGFIVIVDATFLQASHRSLFQKLANEGKFELTIIDFQAPDSTLFKRTQQRRHNLQKRLLKSYDNNKNQRKRCRNSKKKFTVPVNTEKEKVLVKLLAILS